MSETPEFAESPIPLETPADCERALARFLRQIHAGSLDTKKGHALVIGLGTLAKMMRARADDEALARLERLERERGQPNVHPQAS